MHISPSHVTCYVFNYLSCFEHLMYDFVLNFQPSTRVNHNVKLDCAKVVDSIDVEDITEKAAFCRCWKSKNVSCTYS